MPRTPFSAGIPLTVIGLLAFFLTGCLLVLTLKERTVAVCTACGMMRHESRIRIGLVYGKGWLISETTTYHATPYSKVLHACSADRHEWVMWRESAKDLLGVNRGHADGRGNHVFPPISWDNRESLRAYLKERAREKDFKAKLRSALNSDPSPTVKEWRSNLRADYMEWQEKQDNGAGPDRGSRVGPPI